MNRFNGIQTGRAVAALSVLYFHSWVAIVRFPENSAHPFWPLAKFGELGVDLFFAISGFVICLIATRSPLQPLGFFTKRVLRIYPLWLLALLSFAILAALWRGWQNNETAAYLLHSATLLPTKELPFYGIGWTLQHEMAFYVVVAALMPFIGTIGVVAFLVLSFALLRDAPWYISSLTNWHLEFAAGMLAFLLWPRLRWTGAILPICAGTIGLAVLFHYFGRSFVAPALFVAIIGFANLNSDTRIARYLVELGDRSYSIYLIHPIIFWGCSAVTSKVVAHVPLWSLEPIRFACIFFAVFVSRFTWKAVEKPAINFGSRLARRLSTAPITAPAAT